MQIGNVTNQYINTYNNTAQVQVANQQETRAAEKLSEQQLMEFNQEQQRWLAYIMMMQFFAKENMWSLLNQMRIQRTLDLTA